MAFEQVEWTLLITGKIITTGQIIHEILAQTHETVSFQGYTYFMKATIGNFIVKIHVKGKLSSQVA